jgi:magnesium transporter
MARRIRKAPGLPPGTLIAPHDAVVPQTVHVITYSAEAIEEADLSAAEAVARARDSKTITWLNIDGLGNVDMIREIGEGLRLHPLAMEDTLSVPQRPKVDDYENHLYGVLRMLSYRSKLETEQVSFFLTPATVVTFQERPGDCLDPVRERLRKQTGHLRQRGADYLMYAIVDAIVDGYFPFLESLGDTIEGLEDDVIAAPVPATLQRIHQIKRDLLTVRRCVWPLRDAIGALARAETPLIDDAVGVYLRDCQDHAIQILDIVETHRELSGGLVDLYLSGVSNRMNEVMKVLTMFATIFIPLTFIAGIYGMNFEFMPELKWKYAYPALWGVMIAVTAAMLALFYRKGWFGDSSNQGPPPSAERDGS